MNPQMNILTEEWNVIESYLDQNEDREKTLLLKEDLDQIPDLDQKIEYVKKMREEIEDCIRMSKIKEFHKGVLENEKTDSRKRGTKRLKLPVFFYSVAAILLVLIGIFWMFDSNTSGEKIFAENFKPDIGLPLKMSSISSYGFYEGMLDYKQENYEDAIVKWNVLLKTNPDNDTLNYFLGVANLALGKADESLDYLQNQDRFKGGMFEVDAAYYAALAKIKEDKLEEAKVFLKNNPSTRNTNLLKELENR